MEKSLSYKGKRPERYDRTGRGIMRAALELAYAKEGYELGEESTIGTDCSGIPSYAFTRNGWPIRLTADGFYRLIYTATSLRPGGENVTLNAPALFVITEETLHYDSGYKRLAGSAIHVAPFVGESVVMDAWFTRDLVSPIPVSTFFERYTSSTSRIVVGYPVVHKLDDYSWTWVDGLDPTIMDYTR